MDKAREYNRHVVAVAFVGWTAASYLYFLCTKLCVSRLGTILKRRGCATWLSPLMATILQMITCFTLVDFSFARKSTRRKPDVESNKVVLSYVTTESQSGEITKLPDTTTDGVHCTTTTALKTTTTLKEIITIIIVSHGSGSFLTNFGLFSFKDESLIVIKFMEPLITAVLYKVVVGCRIPRFALFSLPVIAGGAMGFGIGSVYISKDKGHFLTTIATILLSVRNLSFSEAQQEYKMLRFRPVRYRVAYVLMCVVFLICIFSTNNFMFVRPFLLGLLSSLFYLTSSYISLCIILNNVSVISHSIANLWKRIFTLALLAVSNNKRLSPTSASSLGVCFLGLLVYLKSGKDKSREDGINKVPLSEQSNRLIFIIFLGIVCGLFFYNLPVSFSDRDIHSLQYLKLGGIARYVINFSNQSTPT